jgi:hypothetical protein
MTRKFSSISVQTSLSTSISSTATIMTVTAGTAAGLLQGITLGAGNVDQVSVAIDHDTPNEEIVWVTGVTTDTLTIARGKADTSNVAHTAGASVKHVLTGEDLNSFVTNDTNTLFLTGAQSISGVKTFSAAPVISTITNTGTLTLPTSTDTIVGRATTDTLTNKSIAATKEITTVSATAATGTINFDAVTQGVLYYTTSATANWTVNVRGNSSTTLNTLMNTNDTLTIAFLVTQGATAYYNSAFTIDGTSVTPKWQGASAPGAGNANSIDAYVYTIVKTASATFTVLASITRFA